MKVRFMVSCMLSLLVGLLVACAAPASQPGATVVPTQPPTAQSVSPAPTTGPGSASSALPGTAWALSKLATATPVAKPNPATIEFNAQGQISGSSGCNSFFANYSVNGKSLTIDQLGSTLMSCSPELMQQEESLFATLGHASSYMIVGETLTITASDGTSIVFTRTL